MLMSNKKVGIINEKEMKKVCMKNGRFCAMCHTELILSNPGTNRESIIAELAHIRGRKPGSARYDPTMNDGERDASENILLLCTNCHKKIDDQPEVYTTKKLQQIKNEYELWVSQRLKNAIVNITFSELNIVTKFLSSGQAITSDSYIIVPPKDKIRKNGLSQNSEHLIMMGMTQVKQVAEFIDKCPDIDFGDRLKIGFVVEYEKLKNEESLLGDDLFNSLLDFASGGATDFKQRAAGLAVLVYLFEKCEVFER